MALENSTISLGFSLDRLVGNYALVSKDAQGTTPGDFTVWVEDGTLSVELATSTGTQYLNVPSLILSAHTTYQFAVSFGLAGLSVWVNGELVAAEPEATQSIATNTRPLIIGASHAWNGVADPAHSLFKGTISEVQVYGSQIGKQDMLTLADAVEPGLADVARAQLAMEDLAPVFQQLPNGSDTLVEILGEYGVDATGTLSGGLNMMTRGRGDHVVTGTDAADGINAGFGDDEVNAGNGNDVVQGTFAAVIHSNSLRAITLPNATWNT